jgi:hypothetical protein
VNLSPPTARVERRGRTSRAIRVPVAFAATCALAALTASGAAASTTGATASTTGAAASTTGAAASTTGAAASTRTTGSTAYTASSAVAATNASISSNWSGYAISGSGGVTRHFRRITGSWVQPAVTCTPGSRTYSAFWVGIGGLSQSSRALEQTGTEADCDAAGAAHYSTWYELVPAGPVTVRLTIAPGDAIKGSVAVADHVVTMTLRDLTSGASVTKQLPFAQPDTTSAEWIAEAPSTCNGGGDCRPLPLSDFGSVTFTGATARLHDRERGAIGSPLWTAVPIDLNESSGSSFAGHLLGTSDAVTAVPSALAATGDSFGVTWAEQPQQQPAPAGGSAPVLSGFAT